MDEHKHQRSAEMKEKCNKPAAKNDSKKVVRLSQETEKKMQSTLAKLNSSKSDCGKVDRDTLICFLLDEMTADQQQRLLLSTLTWDIEEKRLMQLWAKKNGKVTSAKWKEFLYTGQLSQFIKEHSRLAVRAQM